MRFRCGFATVAGWHGDQDRRVEIATGAQTFGFAGTAIWQHPGLPLVPLRRVLARDRLDEFRPQAFLCTDQDAAPDDILTWSEAALRTSRRRRDLVGVPRPALDRLTALACYAA